MSSSNMTTVNAAATMTMTSTPMNTFTTTVITRNIVTVVAAMTMTSTLMNTFTTTTNMRNTATVITTMMNIPMNTIAATITTRKTVTAAVSMNTDMRNPITRLVIPRTASVNYATRMRITVISAARVLQTASVICRMPTVKRKSIS